MKIGELAKVSGLAAHTIRFYESKGLLPKTSRGPNGYRSYDDESTQRLARIQCAKRLGFSLEDILTVLADSGPTEGLDHEKILHQLDVRRLEVETLMDGLVAQRDEIIQFRERLQENWQEGKCLQVDEMFEENLTSPRNSISQ